MSDQYEKILDILVDALENGEIEMGLPKNSKGKGGYSISNNLTSRLADHVDNEVKSALREAFKTATALKKAIGDPNE